ncbi:MAG: hypothetical protein IJT29_00255 [Oscillospiraceae bacterium]|nr:hypothetical protein [Oscillospiraceae bacterium]
MDSIRISDITMKQLARQGDGSLSFKGKIEVSKLLDKLAVPVIEIEGVRSARADALRIKSIAAAVKNSVVAVPVELSSESVEQTWEALKTARHPRLQVPAPVSTVQMEYLSRKKPDAMLKSIEETLRACAAQTADVEFIAEDATRSDEPFLQKAIETAVDAGATTVTLCDATGTLLPEELAAFLKNLIETVPALGRVTLGIACANTMAMADACTVAAVRAGAREVKTAAVGETASLQNVAGILAAREELFGLSCPLHTVELKRIVRQIVWLCQTKRNKTSPFDDGVQDAAPELSLSPGDDVSAVSKAARELGYDLSGEDEQAVWEAVQELLRHKEQVGGRELDAIIASVALQVPQSYTVESYVINSGSNISAMAHLKLSRAGESLEGVALGDGPIDASFLALEKVVNRHYELDDFQIRAVTEGREAMGETVVRLVSNGKLYSGRGISTDIVFSSIQAYVNALNKIAYEEGEA